jgi:hypothetical protein
MRVERKGMRSAFFPDRGWTDCSVYERCELSIGAALTGPALVEDVASTLVIPHDAAAVVDAYLNLVIRPASIDDIKMPTSVAGTSAKQGRHLGANPRPTVHQDDGGL